MADALAPLLAPFDAAVLDRDPSTTYALDETLRIRFVNQAWHAFARKNGAPWPENGQAWGVGSDVLAAISEPLRPFYEKLFAEARRTREPTEHTYECSTPERLIRYRMRILPCGESGLLIVHSPAYDAPHPSAGQAPDEARYRNAHGFIVQCSHCRRVRREDASGPVWDWVAAYVEHIPPDTSHGLCDVCVDYYYRRR